MKIICFLSTCDEATFVWQLLSKAIWPVMESDLSKLRKKKSVEDSSRSDNDDDDEEDSEIDAARRPLIPCHLFRLHGQMSQLDRQKTLLSFARVASGSSDDSLSRESGVLFCTDVAARGLDLPHVDWIVQMSLPEHAAEYVHRVGRTARLGQRGQAVLFVQPHEQGFVPQLEKATGSSLQEISLASVLSSLKFWSFRYINSLPAAEQPIIRQQVEQLLDQNPPGAILQQLLQLLTSTDKQLHHMACAAYRAFVRSYAAYPREMKEFCHPKLLHLGHVARSFALVESPSNLVGFPAVSLFLAHNSTWTAQVRRTQGQQEEAQRQARYQERRDQEIPGAHSQASPCVRVLVSTLGFAVREKHFGWVSYTRQKESGTHQRTVTKRWNTGGGAEIMIPSWRRWRLVLVHPVRRRLRRAMTPR